MSIPEIQAKPESVDKLLREGFSDPLDQVNEEALEFLLDRGVIRVERPIYVRCANPDDPDYEGLTSVEKQCEGKAKFAPDDSWGISKCVECGREILRAKDKEQIEWIRISALQDTKVVEKVHCLLKCLDIVQCVDLLRDAVLDVTLQDDRRLEVVFPEFARFEDAQRGLFFDTPTLFIHANKVEYPDLSKFGESQHMVLSELLTANTADLSSEIDRIAVRVAERVDLTETRNLYEEAIECHRGEGNHGEYLEQALQELLKRISDNPSVFEKYLRLNRRLKGTVYDRIVLSVGKQGTDIHLYPKSEFLDVLEMGSLLIECKCYGKNKAGVDAYRQVYEDYRSNRDTVNYGLLIVHNDHMSKDVWEKIKREKELNGGTWAIMIFPIAIFLELIHFFRAEDILEGRLEKKDKEGYVLKRPA